MNAMPDSLVSSRRVQVRDNGHRPKSEATRRGLSLLEVILAIAILGMSMVTLAELVRIGSRSAREARELTVAQLLCEAKLSEVAMGLVPAQAATQQPCETDPNWVFSIDVQPANETGLMIVMVRVSEAQPSAPRPLEFTLTRWMVDPNLDLAALSASTSTDGSSTNSSSGTSSSGTGSTSGSSGTGGTTTSGGSGS